MNQSLIRFTCFKCTSGYNGAPVGRGSFRTTGLVRAGSDTIRINTLQESTGVILFLFNPSEVTYEFREINGSESIAMETAARRSGGGLSESFYRLVMRRNSVYVTFIIAGAFFGERVRTGMASRSLIISSNWVCRFSWIDCVDYRSLLSARFGFVWMGFLLYASLRSLDWIDRVKVLFFPGWGNEMGWSC